MLLIQALQKADKEAYTTLSEFILKSAKMIVERNQKSKKINKILEQYSNRPVLSEREQMRRAQELEMIVHMAVCEGHEQTELNEVMDQLYIKGQMSLDERDEILLLKYS